MGIDGRIILNRSLKKYGVRVWNLYSWFRTGSSDGLS
jgi:hypothetical protein